MQSECICDETLMVEEEGLFLCSECGVVKGRALRTKHVPYGYWYELPSVYSRSYRFRTLLRDLTGGARIPDHFIQFFWERKEAFSTPELCRETLLAHPKYSRFAFQIPTIMAYLGKECPKLSVAETERAWRIFVQLDHEIGVQSGLQVAFTFLVPVIMYLIQRPEIQKEGFLKPISKLLWKKYRECVADGLISLGYALEVLEEIA